MIHRPDHDPLLLAGFSQCPICGAVGFPVEAAWASDALIVVTYGPTCRHKKAITMLVNPEEIPRVDFDPGKYVPGRRCTGRNRHGRSCRARARPGSDYCGSHQTADAQGGR